MDLAEQDDSKSRKLCPGKTRSPIFVGVGKVSSKTQSEKAEQIWVFTVTEHESMILLRSLRLRVN